MATLADLKAELEPFKNTLVIDDFDTVVRLVDVIDGEDDYYWVYDSRKGIYHSSCVGGLLGDRDVYRDWETDRKSTRLNSSHSAKSRMPSSA